MIHDPLFSVPPGAVEIAPGIHAPSIAFRWRFSRSSGPGGQNVNKLNTRAELWLRLDDLLGLRPRARQRLTEVAARYLTNAGELHIAAETTRSQEANRQQVLDRLRAVLLEAMHEPAARRKTRPTRASQRRRIETKKRRSQVKQHRRSVHD